MNGIVWVDNMMTPCLFNHLFLIDPYQISKPAGFGSPQNIDSTKKEIGKMPLPKLKLEETNTSTSITKDKYMTVYTIYYTIQYDIIQWLQ